MDLRWYQKEAVDAAYDHLCTQQGNPVICLPTGSGKSLVIAEIARRAIEDFKGRVIVLQHRKELIEQNAEKVRRLLSIPVGEYSAGLRSYATREDVVLAGIQSVYDKATLFDRRQLVLIDEVHLVPSRDEGMYRTFLTDIRAINPDVRFIGLTATPYRTGEGSICQPDGIFQKVCYDAPIKRLIEEGFLSKLTNQPSDVKFDTSNLHMRYGEFITSELENLFGGEQVAEAVKEVVAKTSDRKSIMVFCTSIKHANSVAESLEKLTGESIAMIEGNTTPLERAAILSRFKNGQIRWLVNIDVLTTGFDAPGVDAIAILRATASPGLFAQIVGRGLRTAPGKEDCLILDFGANIARHGPIDSIEYGKPKKIGERKPREPGEVKEDEKACPNCDQVMPKQAKSCECGFNFPPRAPNHERQADTNLKILSDEEPERFEVIGAHFGRHEKKDKLPSMRVSYEIEGHNMPYGLSEWICVEHEGFARRKAEQWWKEHCSIPCPDSIDEAIDLAVRGWVAIPKTLTAVREGKFWRIVQREIEEIPLGREEGQEVEEMPF
jgi:DNA repair protein RadD